MIRSPRFIRPHQIVIKNHVGEIDGTAQYQSTTVKYVCVDDTYGIKQNQKGVQNNGDLLVVVDMNDLVAFKDMVKRRYVSSERFENSNDTSQIFTLRPDIDFITYKGRDFTINEISCAVLAHGEPEFMEITASE